MQTLSPVKLDISSSKATYLKCDTPLKSWDIQLFNYHNNGNHEIYWFFSVIVSPVVVERIYLGFGLTPILHIFIWRVIFGKLETQ